MRLNEPEHKANMTLEFARRLISRIASDLKQLEVREANREAIHHVRVACEQVQAISDRLDDGTLDPTRAVDDATKTFERLSQLRARINGA